MSLYYCRRVVSFVTDIETFIVTDVLDDVTAEPFFKYVDYFLCAVMMSVCIITSRVCTVMGSKIRVRTIVGSNSYCG